MSISIVDGRVSTAEIFEWVAAEDIGNALQDFSVHVRQAAQTAESQNRALLVHTAIGTHLLDKRSDLLLQVGIINEALGNSLFQAEESEQRSSESHDREIGSLTVVLRGLHRIGETCTPSGAKRNVGYLGLRDRIEAEMGVEKSAAAMAMRLLTRPDVWELKTGEGDPEVSIIYFHPEDDVSHIPRGEAQYADRYPKAVSFNGLTYDKCLEPRGVSSSRAAVFMTVLEMLAADQRAQSHR